MLLRAVSLVVSLIVAVGLAAHPTKSGSSAQTPVQGVDSGSFFCSFACTPGACAVSRQVFERCKQCPQSQVAGCLMAASGVPIDAARTAMNAGTMLPPPGNCPASDVKGAGKVKPLGSKDSSDDDSDAKASEDSSNEDDDANDSDSSSSEDDEDSKEDEDSSSDEDGDD